MSDFMTMRNGLSKLVFRKSTMIKIKTDSRILHAWLFGSFARNESHENSDIDVIIEMKADKPYTLFDLFEI